MSRTDLPKIYNPATQSSQELIENFVVRTKLFKEIYEDIKNSDMRHPEQHYIIQGIRGQGKTTLLLRIAYEIENNEELRKKLIPIRFNEEQYTITRLFKLWESIAEYLEEIDEIGGLYEAMQIYADKSDYEWQCFHLLENSLKEHNKKAILFIDNIDEMFSKFSEKDLRRLREVFTETAEMRIIGASSVSLEFHYDYGQPFYQFFKIPSLKGLDTKETKILLLKLGEYYQRDRVKSIVANEPGRIEALRRITDGVIRTIIMLFEFFINDAEGNAYKDLENLLDRVTPLYNHRMSKLPPQLQEIVDFIALSWDAVSTKDIAKKTKLKSGGVSSQLKQLEKFQIVEKIPTGTKNYLYRISERFFNIWYLMRHGRKWDEKRVRFFVEFLQTWCDSTELEKRAYKHLEGIKSASVHDKQALFITESLARTPLPRELQHRLIEETKAYLEVSKSEMKKYLSPSDLELEKKAEKALKAGELKDAIAYVKSIKNKDAKDLNVLGILYLRDRKTLDKAVENLLMAVEKDDTKAMNSLAWSYFVNRMKKKTALSLALRSYNLEKTIFNSHTLAMILLWHDEIEQALETADIFLKEQDSYSKFPEDINLFFLLLMAKKQYHLLLKIFTENPYHLKDRFKPIYFALMSFLRKENPNEYLKMGSEFSETVEEIIKKIYQMENDYK